MKTGIVLLAFLTLAAMPAPGTPAGDTSQTITVGGVQRTYVLHVPAQLKPSPPLILAFHGHFGTGAGQARLSGFDALADRYGFVVAYPDGINRGWNDGRSGTRDTADDLGFARALVAELSKRYGVDPKRVYATGMSNGATFSQYLACDQSTTFAAIAPVSGSMPAADEPTCRPQRAISVLEIGGTADPIMPYDGGAIKLGPSPSRGLVLSVDATVAFWANNAGCAPAAVSTDLPAIAPPDGTSVTRSLYHGCRDGAGVVKYAIVGAGHTWPDGPQYLPKALIGVASNQLEASQTIVQFFLAHPMR
jgi:polyhydroxybutyrate depolymerase